MKVTATLMTVSVITVKVIFKIELNNNLTKLNHTRMLIICLQKAVQT